MRGLLQEIRSKSQTVRNVLGRPLSYAEKILYGHLVQEPCAEIGSQSYLKLRPDRIALQDASAQLALLQFMSSGRRESAVPVSVHCDHYVSSERGASLDLQTSQKAHGQVYEFLKQCSAKYGLSFWGPGSGIIHQLVLENYAMPGTLLIGTDSHTPNGGGLGGLCVGVGGVDAAEVMSGVAWELGAPRVIGVRLSGRLREWVSAKDVVLEVVGRLSVRGATGCILEYFGKGADSLSATGMATICNMGAEMGATSSIFPYSARMGEYLKRTGREEIFRVCQDNLDVLSADPGSEKYYSQILEIDLSRLEPRINGPFSPDVSSTLSEFKASVLENSWPINLSAALIGSCTNSSYQDMCRAASIARQASERGLSADCEFIVSPGSEMIRATLESEGVLRSFEYIGGIVMANACGPCIGQWKRKSAGRNSIINSFNRNFSGRNDGNSETHSFISSPEIVTAMALAGNLGFNPLTDVLKDSRGKEFMLEPPQSLEFPPNEFEMGRKELGVSNVFEPNTEISFSPNSERLQKLEAWPQNPESELVDLPVLVKAFGKCTTDHISPAGPWLKYKGHLENISHCTLIGAVCADTKEVNRSVHYKSGYIGSIPEIAFQYKDEGVSWVVIGDHNYGEGSAREHAAMQPRFLGCRAVLVKSFARIHEVNLKKQGILPLTFSIESDYDLVKGDSCISIRGLDKLEPNKPLEVGITSPLGESVEILVNHSMSEEQINWYKSGSCLNYARCQA